MNIHEKIEVGVRGAAEKLVQIRFRQIANEKFDAQKEIDRIVGDAAEYIRSEILKDVTAKLNGARSETKQWTASEIIKPFTSKPKTIARFSKKVAKPVVAQTKQISDDMLLSRIEAILVGAGPEGSSIASLFQRIGNHRDVIGTGLTIDRISRIVHKSLYIRRSVSGRYVYNQPVRHE